MTFTWNDILHDYEMQHFKLFTRDNILHTPINEQIQVVSVPHPVRDFMQQLSDPNQSIWSAFLHSVHSIHPDVSEKDIFSLLKGLLEQAVNVVILYGEHHLWKSPSRWSYLFQVRNPEDRTISTYLLAHPPATFQNIRQAENILRAKLPTMYVDFLKITNGLGLNAQESRFLCGIGDTRAIYEKTTFSDKALSQPPYHEIASYWFQWQEVFVYERQRDVETGINTFQSDEKLYIPFAYTSDNWCFIRQEQSSLIENPIFFWDHEDRKATLVYQNLQEWFESIVVKKTSRE
jgi:hypothetical protein